MKRKSNLNVTTHKYTRNYRAVRADIRRNTTATHFELLDQGQWHESDPPKPMPLYNRPKLRKSDEVVVVECERCADAFGEYGVVATTSIFGPEFVCDTDWSLLAGKTVTIMPINDKKGLKYQNDVIKQLIGLHPKVTIKLIDTSMMSPREDIVSILERTRSSGRDRDSILRCLEIFLSEAKAWNPRKILDRGHAA